jgi:hypothetical protein
MRSSSTGPLRWVALTICAILSPGAARASWQYDQLNPPSMDIGGWDTQIVTNDAGTPIIIRRLTDSGTKLYELPDAGLQPQFTFPSANVGAMDLAASPDRHKVAIARMSYTSVTGDPKLNLQLIERTPIGGWSTRTVDADIGVNSGDAGLAYGPTGQPSIAYVRSNTQSLELTTRASDGTWQNTTVTTGPEFSLFKLVDLGFDGDGAPHVMFNDSAGLQHASLGPSGWQIESVSTPAWVGNGTSFDRNGRMYVPVRFTYPYGGASVIYVRDETGWSTLNGSVMTDASTEPVVALDSIDRPHLLTIAKIANRFAVRHRWWNGAAWRQETIACWGSNTSGPQAASFTIDNSNLVQVAFTDTKTDGSGYFGGDLYNAHAPNTALGTPLLIPTSYDVQANGAENGMWTITDGGSRINVGPSQTGENRALFSFDLSSLPEGAQIIGAELDIHQAGHASLGLGEPIRARVYAFPDNGVAEPGDADLGLSDWQVGFLDPVSAFYQDEDDLVVTRFLPQNIAAAISAARAVGDSHIGILIAPNDNGTDPIYSTEWTTSGLFHTIAPRLWLYLRQPGDFNADGKVDSADYVIWRNSNAQSGTNLPADANSDGHVDSLDYQTWRANFGQSLESGLNTSTTFPFGIPEPSTAVMALATFIAAAARRRSRRLAA